MAELQVSDGRPDLEGKEGQSDAQIYSEQTGGAGPGSGVESHMEADDEGDSVGDENHSTIVQKLRERVTDAGNHMKGKESSVKEDPHPELAYIPPGEGAGKEESDNCSAEKTSDVSSLSKVDNAGEFTSPETEEHKYSGEGADELTTMEKIKAKYSEVENQLKGKGTSESEDPNPELAYISPTPQEQKPGFFSKPVKEDKSEEEEGINPAVVPLEADKGIQPEVQSAAKGVGSSELGTGYEEDTESSFGTSNKFTSPSATPVTDVPKETSSEDPEVETTSKEADVPHSASTPEHGEEVNGAAEAVNPEATTEDVKDHKDHKADSVDEKQNMPGFFRRLAKKLSAGRRHGSA